jgi:hypothetical protein
MLREACNSLISIEVGSVARLRRDGDDRASMWSGIFLGLVDSRPHARRNMLEVLLLMIFSLFSSVSGAYDLKEFKNYPPLPFREYHEFIEFRNFPESKLCIAVKDVLGRMSSHERHQEIGAKGYAVVNQIVFPGYRTYPVKFVDIKPKRDEKRVTVGYVEYVSDLGVRGYLLDLDNDGVQDFIGTKGEKFGIFGAGIILSLYQRAWIFDDQPVPRESRSVKKWISPIGSDFTSDDPAFAEKYFLNTFRIPDGFFPASFYIDPFCFDQKNYLLFESNQDYPVKLFWVAELLPDGKLITHCYF